MIEFRPKTLFPNFFVNFVNFVNFVSFVIPRPVGTLRM